MERVIVPAFRRGEQIGLWPTDGPLTAWFADLYAERGPSLSALRPLAYAYFDAHANPDNFFFNFELWALPRPSTPTARTQVWEPVQSLAHDWERDHQGRFLHKGGGYYFAAVRDILLGDLDRGFLYMHQAVREDERTYGSSNMTAARAFVTLDPSPSTPQPFLPLVARYAAIIQRRLASYRRHRSGRLTMRTLRRAFVQHPALLEPLLAIAFVIARLERLQSPFVRPLRSNDLAGLILGGVAFDLTVVTETVLHANVAARVPQGKPPLLGRLLEAYSDHTGRSLDGQAIKRLSRGFSSDFDAMVADILGSRPVFGRASAFSQSEADLAICLGVRNHAAHRLPRSPLLGSRFDRTVTRLFFALFGVIEEFYP